MQTTPLSPQQRLAIRREIEFQVTQANRAMKPGDQLSPEQMVALAAMTAAVVLALLFWGGVLIAAIPLTVRLVLPRQPGTPQPGPRLTETAREAMQGQRPQAS